MSDQFLPTSPDWGIYPNQQPGTEPDLGEVAARLGGLSTYRRTGRLIWSWDSINIQGWDVSGAVYNITSLKTWISPASVLLHSGMIIRQFPPFVQTMGLELTILVTPGLLGRLPEFDFTVYHYTPAGLYSYTYMILWNTQEVKLITGGVPPTLFTFPYPQLYQWHNIKFTLDLANNTYGWVYFNDISQLANMHSPNFGLPPGLQFDSVAMINQPGVGFDGKCYITNLLLTTNESVA